MWEAVITSLVNNLGGTAGFGEFSLARNDDGSTPFIDVRPIFGAQGINFFGHYYTGFYLNNNGSVTFNTATSSFTPTAITGSTSNPVIAAYWADIDTRGGTVAPTAGGTSTGSNLLWYDLDSTTHTFTATWDDVGYYSSQTNKLNAFQISIHEINDLGDFDIIYRYENIDWTTGGASGGSNGLGGTPARAGYSAGNGTDYFELPQSGNQAALLALESASNVGTPGTFVFSVRNGVPTVGVTVGDASLDEGDGPDPGYIVVPVFLTEPSSSTVTVHYSTANGTALAGQDYVAQSGTLTFAPGVTQQNIQVAVTGDAIVEGNESFTVTLSDPSEGASILDGSATGTIVDDDAALSITAAGADAVEGDAGTTAFTFTVTRTGDTTRPATASWAVSGPAVNGADFAGGTLPSGTVTLGIGETSKTITLHVAGDTQLEGDESFTVILSDPGPGTSLGTASATGVIHNDDFAPASLSIAATSADKAESQSDSTGFIFTVTRTGDLSSAASAQWTVGGEQVDGADFAGGELPSGVVSFAAGESSKVITVDVAGDTAVESDEAFTVTLSDPSAGAVIGTASAEGVIRNDDASLSIAATSADKAEGQSETTAFTFTVTRTGDLSSTASASWAVTGPAVNGADFAGGVLPSGQVNFAAGESSQIITIDVDGDTTVESNEAFSVTLSDPSAGAILVTASANGVIRNDDASLSIAA
ncbi:MAG: Calx-beta domain-containing protein, partial [Pseudomonadota bacterium]